MVSRSIAADRVWCKVIFFALALIGVASCGGGGGGSVRPDNSQMVITPSARVVCEGPAFVEQFGEARSCSVYTSDGLGRDGLEGLCTSGGGRVLSGNDCRSGASITCSGVQSGLGYKHYYYGLSADEIERYRSTCASSGATTDGGTTQAPPSDGFPAAVTPRNPPQASGRNISGVEVAGDDTLRYVLVRNGRSDSITYTAGSWLEPRDGGYQRMIVAQTVTVPGGRTAELPTACMQRQMVVPDRGIRFFSQAKLASSSVQECQVRCLRTATDLQTCVWDCESEELDNVPEPHGNRFGAIAVMAQVPQGCVSRGAGWTNDYASRSEAESAALTECRNISGANAASCTVALWWQNSCGAYAEGDRCGIGFSSPRVHTTDTAARQAALSECSGRTTNCRVIASLCTSGR